MCEQELPRINKWRRRCFLVLIAWLLTTFLLSFSAVRGFIAYPLYVHDDMASGDAAYVMAGGYAYWERLRAASDLYHWKRVPQITLLDEQQMAGYNFTRGESETRVERAIDYLGWHGVPQDVISTIHIDGPVAFGSLAEARAMAEQKNELQQVVVVTSAPHTRRSRMAFRRSYPDSVKISVYAASPTTDSAERHAPIWIEYVKLIVYFFVA